ncbi:hypothetical protein [Endothiovibrio diazotrophicus]
MPIRLIVIPTLLALLGAIVAASAWIIEIPDIPAGTSMQKMSALERGTVDAEFRWEKAKEIAAAGDAVVEAQRQALTSGLVVYRWSFALILLLASVQLWLTFAWWKRASPVIRFGKAPTSDSGDDHSASVPR